MENREIRSRALGKLKLLVFTVCILVAAQIHLLGQDNSGSGKKMQGEYYGNTLNLGLGIGYYGYLGQSVPFINVNYEFSVAKNFTVAPFLSYASYRSIDDYGYGSGYYYYRETVVPIGAKGTYYLDDLLGIGPRWDIYVAASLGFVYDHVVWDDGYNGNTGAAHTASPLYLDAHLGAEYHFNRRLGMYLDLSSGISTIGLAIHHK